MEDVDKLDNIQDGFSTTSSYSFAKRPGCNISTAMCQRVIQEMVDKIKALDSKAENRLAQDHPHHQRTHTLALYEDPTCFTNASSMQMEG
jgi:hypothetical protein